MSYIRKDSYVEDRKRPNLLTDYLNHMVRYLHIQNPNRSVEEITDFVKSTIKDKYKVPTVTAVYHKTEGNSEFVTMPLDKYIVDIVANNNLSPSGTSYFPVSVKESFLRISLEDKIKARNKFKKLYLEFEAKGQKRESQYYNQSQANAKIFNNAIAGGMNIKQFILGCKAGFNAITSVGRMSVKQGYSFIERLINGNIYLPNTQAAITYILNHTKTVHEDFENAIQVYSLYIPTVEDVVEYILNNVSNYVSHPNVDIITKVIKSLTDVERAYLFYVGCMKNLCYSNDHLMREWVESCFLPEQIDYNLYKNIDINDVKSFRDDVVVCVLSTAYKCLGENPEKPGKYLSIKDAKDNNPDGLKEFIYRCKHFVESFETLIPLLRSILQINTTFTKLVFQHRMARHTVPLSDTDSNIFSTQELIKWKRKKLDFSQESYEMNALTTFIITQSLEHVFARLSSGYGVETQNVFDISMKNEFLFPVLIVTSLAKHYIAVATMQEGKFLDTPRKEIKGVGLRSSAYPKLIRDNFEEYMTEFVKLVEKSEPIRAATILNYVANLEKTIYDSVQNRESIYLQTISIRRKEDYADPSISAYFYYKLWTAVFSEEYGEMVIPNKCYKIPLKGGKKLFKDKAFLEKLSIDHPGIYQRLIVFIESHPDRDITAILIPPFKGQIHPFFLEIMDIRSHISQSMSGFYHFLRALGLGTVDSSANALVSDFYDPSTHLLE